MRSCSDMAGHRFVRWVVRLSIRPLGKFSPHSLQVWGYLRPKEVSIYAQSIRFQVLKLGGPKGRYQVSAVGGKDGLEVTGRGAHLLELSASLGPRWKYCWITWLGRRPMAVIAYQDRLGTA